MAYSKSPTQDSHNVERVLVGGESFLTSDGQVVSTGTTGPSITLNYIDCFPVVERQATNDKKFRASKRVGWESVAATSAGAVTAGIPGCQILSAQLSSGYPNVYFAVGGTFYKMNIGSGPPYTVTSIQAATSAYLMGMTAAIDNSNALRIATIDNSAQFYSWDENGGTVATTNLAGIAVSAFRNIVFLDGYLFAATKDKIYNSNANGVLGTWSSTDFIAAEMWPDEIMWLEKHKNYLVVFGDFSTEFFYDAAIEVGSPLARQESYATKIGLVRGSRNKNTAIIEDDIYFMGRTQTDNISLYKVSDFKITPIQNQYFQSYFNTFNTATTTCDFYTMDVIITNNNPMVAITLQTTDSGTGLIKFVTFMYDPLTEIFWQLSTAGTYNTANSDFPSPLNIIGSTIFPSFSSQKVPLVFSVVSGSGTQITQYTPEDGTRANSITSVIYTDIWDHGTNRIKSIHRVDAIGDYDNNTLTLSFNNTPNYSQAYTDCTPTYSAATIGYGNPISWYNLGAGRRWSFKLTMAGYGTSFHEGLELEYNIGVT